MIIINIALVLLGMVIPLVTAIFWAKTSKILNQGFGNRSYRDTILEGNTVHNIFKWLYHHRSKFNIFMAAVVTIIEFLALLQF